jgi:hypothetical protein
VSLFLSYHEFYKDNEFFRWGPPVKFFGHNIESNQGFYFLYLIIFFHQLINNWVNIVVYPWIINSIQDPKNKNMEYPRIVTLLLINLFDIYSEIDVIVILMGFTSQLSFMVPINIANILTSTLVNNLYINKKFRNLSYNSSPTDVQGASPLVIPHTKGEHDAGGQAPLTIPP